MTPFPHAEEICLVFLEMSTFLELAKTLRPHFTPTQSPGYTMSITGEKSFGKIK